MRILSVLIAFFMLQACATMDKSLKLGAGLGSVSGAAATFAGYSAGGKSPSLSTVGIGVGIGSIVGLVTSYFTHKSIEEDRKSHEAADFEMHFGDLPPNPFSIPKMSPKKGIR